MGKLAQWSSIVFLQLIFSVNSYAEQIALKKVWSRISQASPGIQAAELESQAAVEARDRAERHWLPQLHFDAKTYQTNDPGNSFFGLLEQRSLKQDDFNPNTINNPQAEIFTRGALSIDIPLYEGGMKTAHYKVESHMVLSQRAEVESVKIEQYSLVTKVYGSIGILEQQKQKLIAVKGIIDRVVESYQIGIKSNPVGYSGLLGLKSLGNRVKGMLVQNEARSKSFYLILHEMGFNELNWTPFFDDSVSFSEKYLYVENDAPSLKIESLKEKALASQEASQMEKARFRPRIGAFAENYVFSGTRDTANGYSAGFYFQWSLFNPSDYGTLKEAQLKSMAVQKYAAAMEQKDKADKTALDEAIVALKQNISLLHESQKILIEQVQVAEKLFKNGSINALQFVEVLNRRVDLDTQQADAALSLLELTSSRIQKNQFVLPPEFSQGTGL